MEEHTHRAEARPIAFIGRPKTVLMMHDAVDSKPHPIVVEEPTAAHVSTEAVVVCSIESESRKSHQQRCAHDSSVEPSPIVAAFIALVEKEGRPNIVQLRVVHLVVTVSTYNRKESYAPHNISTAVYLIHNWYTN